MMYRNPAFGTDRMQCTMYPLYLDGLPHTHGATGKIAGRGVAMTGGILTCHDCGKQRQYARNCYKYKTDSIPKSSEAHDKQKNKYSPKSKAGSRPDVGRQWCSLHKTTSHGSAGCFTQRAPRLSHNGGAHIAAVLSSNSLPAGGDEQLSLNFDYNVSTK